MNSQKNKLPERVVKWAKEWLVKENYPQPLSFSLLKGDGSQRQFFRIQMPEKSLILLWDPGWKFSIDYTPHQIYLQNLQISVPVFHYEDASLGCLIMEDLGDELLQHRLIAEPKEKISWLEKACSVLANLHGKTFPVDNNIPAATRQFDSSKYREELLFTLEHLVTKFLGLPSSSPSQNQLLSDFCCDLENIGPRAFSHRDYHTRNLLIFHDQLYLVDFQDARMGPVHYDLASLLFDAYTPLSSQERESLIESYRNELRPFPLYQKINWQTFGQDLNVIAFQRVIKAAGSFASFYTRFGKKSHLPYLAPALNIANDLIHSPNEILGRYENLFNCDLWLEKTHHHESIKLFHCNDSLP